MNAWLEIQPLKLLPGQLSLGLKLGVKCKGIVVKQQETIGPLM